MVKLKIININNYNYELQNINDKKYNLNLEFFDIKDNLKVGDYIYMSAELLNPEYAGYSTNYTFGDLKNKYGRKNLSTGDIDVIRIEKGKEKILLKRLYG